jgi:Tfp pilus assembly protein PilX
MVMIVLILIGAAAIITSTTEVEIAGNEKQYQMAFYAADSGANLSTRVIRDTVSLNSNPIYGANPDVKVTPFFLHELLYFASAYNDGSSDTTLINPDVFIAGTALSMVHSVGIDVDRDANSLILPGGGVEFGAGYEGTGGGDASGGNAILYRVKAQSQGPRNSSSTINTRYLYVMGVGGGS